MLQQILDDTTSEPAPGECHLAALTAGDRVTWAKARESFFATGVNRSSLDTIEQVKFQDLSLCTFHIDFFLGHFCPRCTA